MPNLNDANYELRDAPPGFRALRARVGHELGSESIGASLWQLPPGEAAYPYHYHYADEEIVLVVSGQPSLRTPDGVRVLEQGEFVRFATGEGGAHQIFNPTDEAVTFLAVSSSGHPEIVIYPDSGKIGAVGRHSDGSGVSKYFRAVDAIDFWEGEPRQGGGEPHS